MKNSLILIGVIIAVLVGIPAALLGAGYLYQMTAEELPVAEEEKGMLLDVVALAGYVENFEPDLRWQKYRKIRYIDRSWEVEVEYDDSAGDDMIYLYNSVTFERKPSDAVLSYQSMWAGSRLGLNLEDKGFSVEERGPFFDYGDESKFALIKYDDVPVGNLLSIRFGKKIVFMTLSGVYFDEPAVLRGLIQERLDQVIASKSP